MNVINLTPHAINIIAGDRTLTVPPSGAVARCATTRQVVDNIDVDGTSVPVTRTVFGAVNGLPEVQYHVFCIVSSVVAQACPGRVDLLIPDDTVRDDKGQIIGCRALARI